MPGPPPSRSSSVPELLDQAFIQSDEAFLDEDDPPCASEKARKGRLPNNYRISLCPRDTPNPTVSSLGTLGARTTQDYRRVY
jgi:hypothetical protein